MAVQLAVPDLHTRAQPGLRSAAIDYCFVEVAVGSQVIGLGLAVLDTVVDADAAEDVAAE